MSSTNLTSWADASSDEEEEFGRIAPPPSNLPGSDSYAALQAAEEEAAYADHGHRRYGGNGRDRGAPPSKTLADMPTDPPFTAYVRNLNKNMQQKEFGNEIEQLLLDSDVSFFFIGQFFNSCVHYLLSKENIIILYLCSAKQKQEPQLKLSALDSS